MQNNTQIRKLHCVWIPRGVYQIRKKAALGEYILPNQGLVGSVHDGRRVWLLNPIEEQQIQKSWKYAIIQLQFVDKPESLTNVQNILYYWCTSFFWKYVSWCLKSPNGFSFLDDCCRWHIDLRNEAERAVDQKTIRFIDPTNGIEIYLVKKIEYAFFAIAVTCCHHYHNHNEV